MPFWPSLLRWYSRPGIQLRRLGCLVLVFLAGRFPVWNRGVCAGQSPAEYRVKAAYIFNFLKFVDWPGDSSADFHGKWVVGIVGESPVGAELSRLSEGKYVLGRDLLVRKFQASDNLRACNILFISESEKKRLPSILASLRGTSVLTVADMDDFITLGGMIQLLVEDTRVRMAIDVSATSRAHLKVSSKMLLLAHVTGMAEQGASN